MKNLDEQGFQKHESWGLASFSRISTGGKENVLFGSSVTHPQSIRLSISKACKRRELSRDWYSEDEPIVEVELSEAQFGQLISSFNTGPGTPVTIRYIQNKRQPDCPSENRRALFHKEFTRLVKDVFTRLDALVAQAKTFQTKPSIGKGDRETFTKIAEGIRMEIVNNLEYIHSSFDEAMDHTVTEAISEVEAYVNNKIHSLGIEAMRDQLEVKMIDSKPRQDVPIA